MDQVTITKSAVVFDLEERSAVFAEQIIDFCRSLPRDEITIPLITQLVKAAASIGANYCEADDAESRKDFKHKIGISKKEARESKHFLRLLARAVPEKADTARKLWNEAKELNLILNAIFRKL